MKLDGLRVRYFLYCLFHRSGYAHAKYLKKHNAFHSMGENCFFQPFNLPADAKYIKLGNNVVVASNVEFICHDVIHHMLNNSSVFSEEGGYSIYRGLIIVEDNVFIGANSVILPNVTIKTNTIIAAGSMVNKDIPEGKIVGGVPAKVIGNTAEFAERRKEYSERTKNVNKLEFLWEEYEREK